MSDTTGWKPGGRACGCWKLISGVRYEISGGVGGFALWHTPHGYTILIGGSYPTLADAKRAAHDHARSNMKVINSWDGELEGWFEWNSMAGRIYEKRINGIKFKVVDPKDGSPSLDVEADDVATRQTIEECQRLAHATARLWAGDTE